MWVFAYGSLMSDGWELAFDCSSRNLAILRGYERVLNKASVRNWGTEASPCLTLNLRKAEGAECWGVGFLFEDSTSDKVVEYLKRREGGFRFFEDSIFFSDGESALALVSIYEGRNVVAEHEIQRFLIGSRDACGSSGSCREYLSRTRSTLAGEGIVDPGLERAWAAIGLAGGA